MWIKSGAEIGFAFENMKYFVGRRSILSMLDRGSQLHAGVLPGKGLACVGIDQLTVLFTAEASSRRLGVVLDVVGRVSRAVECVMRVRVELIVASCPAASSRST